MANLTVADYLKYANLQMGAEALLFDEAANKLKTDIKAALIDDNGHASKFTDNVRGDAVIVSLFKSRRWRHGEKTRPAGNGGQWRTTA